MKLIGTLIAAGILAGSAPLASAQETSCEVSMAQFSRLQNGMTYQQVISITGCEGNLLSSSEMAGFKTEILAWSGAGGWGANMNAMFQNGRMVSKAQLGLK